MISHVASRSIIAGCAGLRGWTEKGEVKGGADERSWREVEATLGKLKAFTSHENRELQDVPSQAVSS